MTDLKNVENIIEPVGSWWLDDGQDSGVWPCIVTSTNIFGLGVRTTLEDGPYFGEEISVPHGRVYDSKFNRPPTYAPRQDMLVQEREMEIGGERS